MIKIIETKDFDLLKKLDQECFASDYPYSFSSKEKWYILYKNNYPVAFGGFKIIKNKCYLLRAGVLYDYRGRGYHTKLIRRRVKEASKLKLKEVISYTSIDNYASFNNLIREGFNLYRWRRELGGKKRREMIFLWFKLKIN